MPGKLLRQRVARFHSMHLNDEQVGELAREFKVSDQAMAIRLDTLGL
jgi:hypothetical protein